MTLYICGEIKDSRIWQCECLKLIGCVDEESETKIFMPETYLKAFSPAPAVYKYKNQNKMFICFDTKILIQN